MHAYMSAYITRVAMHGYRHGHRYRHIPGVPGVSPSHVDPFGRCGFPRAPPSPPGFCSDLISNCLKPLVVYKMLPHLFNPHNNPLREELHCHSLHFTDDEINGFRARHKPGETRTLNPSPLLFPLLSLPIKQDLHFTHQPPPTSSLKPSQMLPCPAIGHPTPVLCAPPPPPPQHITRWVATMFPYLLFSSASFTPHGNPSGNHLFSLPLPRAQRHAWHLENAQ